VETTELSLGITTPGELLQFLEEDTVARSVSKRGIVTALYSSTLQMEIEDREAKTTVFTNTG